MGFLAYYHDIINTPLLYLWPKVKDQLKKKFSENSKRNNDISTKEFLPTEYHSLVGSYYFIESIDLSRINRETAAYLCDQFLSHRFDLLGSGWVSYGYDSKALGIEGYHFDHNISLGEIDLAGNWLKEVVHPNHLTQAQSIWKLINDDSYVPIDWQRDVKSGFRWSANKWYKDQAGLSSGKIGADIKLPWELSRMQHLPQMAVFAKALSNRREKIIREFRNQVLDFAASNPVNMGVNWSMAMDVGFRTVSLLVAFDLLKQLDTDSILDDEFVVVFEKLISAHARFLVANLEFKGGITNNHYLGNIAGLLYSGAYLESNEESNAWLAFGLQELVNEMGKQFLDDGGNFESSTAYHCLSTEIILHCTALSTKLGTDRLKDAVNALDRGWKELPRLRPMAQQTFLINEQINFPSTYATKLAKAVLFIEHITKSNGEIIQIGDNDSARFIKLTPVGKFISPLEAEEKYSNLTGYTNQYENEASVWDENTLNRLSIIALGLGILESSPNNAELSGFVLEQKLLEGSLNELKLPIKKPNQPSIEQIANLDLPLSAEIRFKGETELQEYLSQNLKSYIYPDFGIYIFKSNRLELFISGTNKYAKQYWSHSNNDKLSFELWIDEKPIVVDPGTYLYGAIPGERNNFRSVYAHNVPIVNNEEQNRWFSGDFGVFRMVGETYCKLVHVSDNRLSLYLKYRGINHVRTWKVDEAEVIVSDQSNKPFEVNLNRNKLYSNGYGKKLRQPAKHIV